ncbi:MAG: N-acetyltransferase family protein [Armatimonadetes bacterium]|nr:N-acetyltransferase family protein [Armatimonadota bacterium]
MMARIAEKRDLSAIQQILNHEIEHGFAHFGTVPISLEQLATEFESRAEKYPWWVLEDEGQVLAVARTSPWKARGGYAQTVEVGIYVRSDQQGKGFGKALYGPFLQAVEAAGFHTLLAGIAQPNEPSVRLHERFGFSHVGTLPEVGFKLGAWRSVGYWAKVLPKPEPQ